MPAVTGVTRASGEPNASTGSPTAIESELPKVTGMRPPLATLITAMSDSGSRPTTLARAVEPSLNETVIVLSAPSTTWSLVITYPSAETTKPEPIAPVTRTVTTLGSTFLTMPACESGARLAAAAAWVGGAPSAAPPVPPAPPRTARPYPRGPPRPPASRAVTRQMSRIGAYERRGASGSVTRSGGGPLLSAAAGTTTWAG